MICLRNSLGGAGPFLARNLSMMASIRSLLSRPLARLWMVAMIRVSHDRCLRKPCWQSVKMTCASKWEIILLWIRCPRILQETDVSEMGL